MLPALVAATFMATKCSLGGEELRMNYVRNGTFKHVGDNGVPQHWKLIAHRDFMTPRLEIAPDSGGTLWARMRLAAHGATFACLTQTVDRITPGEWLRLGYRVRVSRGVDRNLSALVRLIWRDANGVKIAREYVNDTNAPKLGANVTRVYQNPAGAVSLQIDLIGRWAKGGTVSFADISLTPVPPPPPRKCKIAVVQLMPKPPTTPEANRQAFAARIREAGELGADLVVLGEGITVVGTGKTMAEVAEPVPGPTCEVLGEAARANRLYVAFGLYERDGDFIYNTAVLLGRDGNVVGKYRKVHLPEGEMDEGISPGSQHPVFDCDFGRLGLQICYDYAFPESARILALAGAEIIACPIWGDPRAHRNAWEATARARALDNGVYFVGAIYGPARSLIVDPHGDILADANGVEGVYVADADLTPGVYTVEFDDSGLVWRYFKHVYRKERRPDTYAPLIGW